MKLLVAIFAGLVATSAVAAPASPQAPTPGWQFVRWGMTPAELRAASNGAVPANTDPGYDRMKGEYAMGKFKFDVVFDYHPPANDPGNTDPSTLGLDAVMLDLNLKSGSCAKLEAYLKTLYGPPDRTADKGPAGDTWSRKDIGDDVSYSTFDPKKACSVMYMALGASSQ